MKDQYSGRPPNSVPVNLSLDREVAELLERFAPNKRARGRFLSRLIYEHVARQEERQRLRQALDPVLAGGE